MITAIYNRPKDKRQFNVEITSVNIENGVVWADVVCHDGSDPFSIYEDGGLFPWHYATVNAETLTKIENHENGKSWETWQQVICDHHKGAVVEHRLTYNTLTPGVQVPEWNVVSVCPLCGAELKEPVNAHEYALDEVPY